MGMAASQARLLSLTSRMADNELRAQIANNAKMRLAADSSRISADYVNALNNATMMITNYDEAGTQLNNKLTFNRLTQYSAFNTQYGLANTYGQLLVNENEAAIFEAAGGSLAKYLEAHGLEFNTSYFNAESFNGTSVISFTDEKDRDLGSFTLDELKALYFGGTTVDEYGNSIQHRGFEENTDMYESFQNQTSYFSHKYQDAQQDENIMGMIDKEINGFHNSSSALSKTKTVQELREIYADSSDFSKANITEGNGSNKLSQVLTLIKDMSEDVDGANNNYDKTVLGATYDYYNSIKDYYFKVNDAGETVLKDLEDFDFRIVNLNGKEVVEEGQYINDNWYASKVNMPSVHDMSTTDGTSDWFKGGTLTYEELEDNWSHWDGALWKTNYMWHSEPSDSIGENYIAKMTTTNTYGIKIMDSSYNGIGAARTKEGLAPGYVYLSKDASGNVYFLYGQNNSDDYTTTYADLGTNYGSFVDSRAGRNGIYEIDISGQCNGLTVEHDDTLVYMLEGGESGALTSDKYLESNISTANLQAYLSKEKLAEILGVDVNALDGYSNSAFNVGQSYYLLLQQYEDAVSDGAPQSAIDALTTDLTKATNGYTDAEGNSVQGVVAFLLDEGYDEDTVNDLNTDPFISKADFVGLTGSRYNPGAVLSNINVRQYVVLLNAYERYAEDYENARNAIKAAHSDFSEEQVEWWIQYGRVFGFDRNANKAYTSMQQMLALNKALVALRPNLINYLESVGYQVNNAMPAVKEHAFIFTDKNGHIGALGQHEEYHNFAWTTGVDHDGFETKYFLVDPDGFSVSNDRDTKNTGVANNTKAYAFDGKDGALTEHTFYTKDQAWFYIIQNLVQDAFGQYEVEKDENKQEVIKDQKGNFRYSVNLMDYVNSGMSTGNAESDKKLDTLRDLEDKINDNFGLDLTKVESTDFTYVGSYIDQLKAKIAAGEAEGATAQQIKEGEAAKAIYDNYILNCLFDVYGEPNVTWIDKNNPTGDADAKVTWYTNLFERMSKGYKVLEDGLANSNEWIEYALESGLVTVEQVDKANHWNSTVYSNVATITEVTDEVAVARAEAEYKKAMNEIENKDKRLDIELKNIDTEHSALQTEYESVKSVISKNVERSFKMYNA